MSDRFYKLTTQDAEALSNVFKACLTKSDATKASMILACMTQLYTPDNGVPYFTAGYRKLAEITGVHRNTALNFLQWAESSGLIVKLSPIRNKYGEFERRTFSWFMLSDHRIVENLARNEQFEEKIAKNAV